MQPETQRAVVLGALIAGTSYNWVVPAAVSAIWHPLSTITFAVWAGVVAIGSYILISINGLDRPRR